MQYQWRETPSPGLPGATVLRLDVYPFGPGGGAHIQAQRLQLGPRATSCVVTFDEPGALTPELAQQYAAAIRFACEQIQRDRAEVQ